MSDKKEQSNGMPIVGTEQVEEMLRKYGKWPSESVPTTVVDDLSEMSGTYVSFDEGKKMTYNDGPKSFYQILVEDELKKALED